MLWDVTTLNYHLLHSTLFQLLECLDFVVHYKYSRVTFISVPDQRKQSHPSCCSAPPRENPLRNWTQDHTWGLTTPHWIINLTWLLTYAATKKRQLLEIHHVHNQKKNVMYCLSLRNMFQVAKKKAFRLIYGVADVDQSREMGTVAVSAPTFIPI